MAYWLDEGFHSWPEIVRAGTAAAGLYARCGSYIADHGLDGLVPFEVAALYGSREWAKRLVDVGLWSIEEHGYRDLRYFTAPNGSKLNRTAEQARDKLAKNAERQRRWVERQKERRRTANASSNGPPNALGDASLTVPPTLPPSKEGKGGAPAPLGAARPPDPNPNPWVETDDPHELEQYRSEMAWIAEERTRALIADQRRAANGAARVRAALAAKNNDPPEPPPDPTADTA